MVGEWYGHRQLIYLLATADIMGCLLLSAASCPKMFTFIFMCYFTLGVWNFFYYFCTLCMILDCTLWLYVVLSLYSVWLQGIEFALIFIILRITLHILFFVHTLSMIIIYRIMRKSFIQMHSGLIGYKLKFTPFFSFSGRTSQQMHGNSLIS